LGLVLGFGEEDFECLIREKKMMEGAIWIEPKREWRVMIEGSF